jgi:enoyl-CoA hydratase/carnithine racemase
MTVGREGDSVVAVERRDDGVAIVRLDNPKVNALSRAVLSELASAAEALTDDPPGAVVVTGGDRVFAAGADISEFWAEGTGTPASVIAPDEAREIGGLFLQALNGVAAIPRVVIAEVAGFALGGGCELALACDFRIASDRARFGQPEILLGIVPGGGATQRLPRLIGPARAKELIFSGRQVDAEEALRIGLVDEVVPPAELRDRALARAGEFARGPVVAHAIAKRAIDRGLDGPLHDGLLLEQAAFAEVFATEDARIGVASFLEHGPGEARFVGK